MAMVVVMVTYDDFRSMAEFAVYPRSWAHCQNVHRQLFASNARLPTWPEAATLHVCVYLFVYLLI